MAEILIVDYLSKDYEVFKISNIREALEVYSPSKKQLFYYDDFLGQTALEHKLGKNEDDDLVRLIGAVKRSSNTKLIMTTREYILNQARSIYEKLGNPLFDLQCIIALSDFSTFQKAKILYNHLYFSGIPQEFKIAIVANRNYMKVINHPNYNPRIIDWMTDSTLIESVKYNYVDKFLSMLDNPMQLWEHIYSKQLSLSAKHLLLVLSTFPYESDIDKLKAVFNALHQKRAEKFHFAIFPDDFLSALKELEDTFIRNENVKTVRFSNPSIKDFMVNLIN